MQEDHSRRNAPRPIFDPFLDPKWSILKALWIFEGLQLGNRILNGAKNASVVLSGPRSFVGKPFFHPCFAGELIPLISISLCV